MKIINSVETKNVAPEKVANIVEKILNKKKPKYVYKLNRNFGLLCLNALPKRTQNWIIKKILIGRKK